MVGVPNFNNPTQQVIALKVGQCRFISGSSSVVNSILEKVRKTNRTVSFRTEAREGGRLVTRVK